MAGTSGAAGHAKAARQGGVPVNAAPLSRVRCPDAPDAYLKITGGGSSSPMPGVGTSMTTEAGFTLVPESSQ